MVERLRLWIAEWRQREAARDAEVEVLCDHDGSEPMCSRCAPFFNGV